MSKDTSGRSKLNLGREAMTTEAELVSQLQALGIPDWDTARWLMDEAAKRIESQAAEIDRLKATNPPECSILAIRDYQCTCGKVVSFPIDSEINKANELLCQQAAELKRLHDYDTRLTAVMPADFKDWHENSRNEWPEVAAGVITSLRERENAAWKEVQRLKSEAELFAKHTGLAFAAKDTLLRQALEALTESRDDVATCLANDEQCAGYERYDKRIAFYKEQLAKHDAAIAAIKQHLGEV